MNNNWSTEGLAELKSQQELTGVNDDQTGQEALALGAADFLIKPINLDQVQIHLDVYGVLQSD